MTDYHSICDFLNSFNCLSTIEINNVAFNVFIDVFPSSILYFVPQVPSSKVSFMIYKETLDLVFEKWKGYKKYKCSLSPDDYYTFSLCQACFKYLPNQCYHNYISQTELFRNPREFWKFVGKNKLLSGIPNHVILNNIRK